MLARWTYTYGPEFEECKNRWKAAMPRFDLHLASIRLLLERDPYAYSTAFLTENDRVIQSEDFKDGYTMAAFIKIDPKNMTSEIKWVELRKVELEGEDDEDVADA